MSDQYTFENMPSVVMAIFLVVVFAGVFSMIFSQTQDTIATIETVRETNGTISLTNNTNTEIHSNMSVLMPSLSVTILLIHNTNSTADEYANGAIPQEVNASGVSPLGYTFHKNNGTITTLNGTAVYNFTLDYSYRNTSSQPNIMLNKGQEGLFEITDWIPTIALAIAAVIVIGFIMYVFGRMRTRP